MSTTDRPRSIKDGPFFWESKAARRRIREVAGESNNPSPVSVLAVYSGLCELASDAQAEIFEATRGHIAGKACVTVRTVDSVLAVLEKCELLRIKRRKIDVKTNLPSIYTLLSYGSAIKSPPSATASLPPSATDVTTVAPFLKNQKEKKELHKEEGGEGTPAPTSSGIGFPWKSWTEVPEAFRTQMEKDYPENWSKIGDSSYKPPQRSPEWWEKTFQEIRGRKLKYNDKQQTVDDWLSVFSAEIEAAKTKARRGKLQQTRAATNEEIRASWGDLENDGLLKGSEF